MNLSIVIPVYGQFSQLFDLLGDLDGVAAQVLVVEASPAPESERLAPSDPLNLREQCQQKILHRDGQWLSSPASRGAQVALGCEHATGTWLWVLHADTRLECVAFFMNWRSRLTRICTGDQGMIFHRDCIAQVGGFPNQPLMEDIEISRLLKRREEFRFFAPKVALQASGQRWLQNGWLRTILSMWRFRIQYFLGKSPQALFVQYYRR